MNRIAARALAIGVGLAVAMISTTSGLLFYRPLPTIDGHYRLLGLHEHAEVVRDDLGIPRIRAGDLHDVFFLQGYVTAQDRFAQMEAMRQEAFGVPVGPPPDGEVRLALEAYAEGVTKFIDQHAEHRALPVEIVLSGRRPAPWSAADTLAIVALYLEAAPGPSMCIVIPGENTFKGRPLLAAELRAASPAPGWYEIGFDSGNARGIGLSLPGVPGIVAGHNGWIAWSLHVTHLPSDPTGKMAALLALPASMSAATVRSASRLGGCLADIRGAVAGSGPGGGSARGIDVEALRLVFGRPGPGVALARIVVDLAEVDASKAALSTGQSAHRASRHYADQVPLWEAGQLHRLASSRGALGRIEGELVFRAR